MMKRLLVTGYGGFVAGSVLQQADENWSLLAHSRKEVSSFGTNIEHVRFDLRDTDQLQKLFETTKPDAVFHAAAHAKIDYCETHPQEAEEINVGVTGQIGRLCQQYDAKLIFCSTDTVFSGLSGNYQEEDTPQPVNVYGRTKKKAEDLLLEQNQNVVIARLALVMGFPMWGAVSSFLTNFLAAGKSGTEMTLPENEIRSPIDIVTLGQALLELAENDYRGMIHLAGNSSVNRLEMAFRLAEAFQVPTGFINGADSNSVAGRAPRPNDVSLDNSLSRKLLKTPMKDLSEGIEVLLEQQAER